MGIDMANKQNITQDLYKRLLAMTQQQRKSDCEMNRKCCCYCFIAYCSGPTTPSTIIIGEMNVKLPDSSDVVVSLWSGKAEKTFIDTH